MSVTNNFLEYVSRYDDIICFGTGRMFQHFADAFCETEVAKRLRYCIDNNVVKHNTSIMFGDRMITVYSMQKLNTLDLNTTVIVITANSYFEIISQIKKIFPQLSSANYIVYPHVNAALLEESAMQKEIPNDLKITDVPVIPKIIHYCWFGRSPIPERNKEWMSSWKRYCPDYEIIEWNEDNYDITKNAYMREAYEAGVWGFVPDYARLDIIYNYGGIYLDTDVELVKSMDDLLFQDGFVGFSSDNLVALGLGFGAKKEHPVMGKLLKAYETVHFTLDDNSLNMTPAPFYTTEVMSDMGLKKDGTYQIINGLTIFPEKMFSGLSGQTGNVRLTHYSHSIHHWDGSWLDSKTRNENQIRRCDIGRHFEEWM